MRFLRLLALGLCFASPACVHVSPPPRIWKGSLIPPGSRQKLAAAPSSVLRRTTHETNGQVGRTVWQVTLQEHGASDSAVLFTVERILDEPTPGAPLVDYAGGKMILRDRSSTYIYSLERRAFIRNPYPSAVYAGPYREEF
jgi:hypothetical protein